MDPVIIGLITVAILFLLIIILGVHIGFALSLMSVVGLWWLTGKVSVALNILGTTAFEAIRDYVFSVVPLFILMGTFMSESGSAEDLYNAAYILLKKIPGALGIATVIANAVFAAVTGVSVASAAVFSKISLPEMLRLRYNKLFALGTVAGSSVLGMLIPPSVLFIVYGMMTGEAIGKLFIAGILPGLLLAAIYSIGIILMVILWPELAGKKKCEEAANTQRSPKNSSLFIYLKTLPTLCLIILVLGGIWGGFFTPVEASAIGAMGAFTVAVFRGMRGQGLWKCLLETGASTCSILLLLISAQMYARMLTLSGLIGWMNDLVLNLGMSPLIVILLFIIILVLLGCILDSTSILLITIPLMVPVVQKLGFNLIWFGVVMVIATEMGLITPPFGMVVYAMKATLGEAVTIEEIFRGSVPFLLMMALALIIVIVYPPLSTWLPSLMGGAK